MSIYSSNLDVKDLFEQVFIGKIKKTFFNK